jgi:alkylation response protein AidB-like acyl-CoA dehydrogenase
MPTLEQTAEDLVAAARDLAPLIREYADEAERERQLSEPVVAALHRAGIFRMWVPRELGGPEADPVTFMRVLEELARADGSVAWVVANCASFSSYTALLPEEGAHEVWDDLAALVARSGSRRGLCKALAVEGGYRVTGRWAFVSGIDHAGWVVTGGAVYDGDAPRLDAGGRPVQISAVAPRDSITIHDTWYVSGLCGTGSNEYSIDDVFVPERRILSLASRVPRCSGAFYRIPSSTAFPAEFAPMLLGMARTAIDALVELATDKVPTYGPGRALRELPGVQRSVARAGGLLESARAYYYQEIQALWERAQHGDPLDLAGRGRVRLAATHACLAAAEAVDLVYTAGASDSIFRHSRLQRCFRDIHAASQTIMANEEIGLLPAGRVLLGLEPGTPMF